MAGADPAFQWWDDQCLVHHALSNDTHRITGWAAGVLAALVELSPASARELAHRCQLPMNALTEALDTLARLQLVARA